MEIALIILALALIITIIFMTIQTILYLRLSALFTTLKKNVDEIADDANKVVKSQDFINESTLASIDILSKFLSTFVPEVEALRDQARSILDLAEEKAEHARTTMKAARALQRDKALEQQVVVDSDGKPVEVKTIETEKETNDVQVSTGD